MDNNLKPAVKCFQDCTELLASPQLLREKADQDGYLFFRNLLPKENLLQVREEISSEVFQKRGLLDDKHELIDGIANVEEINKLPHEIFLGGFSWDHSTVWPMSLL